MKVLWSKVDNPYRWETEGGALWVGHTVIAVWIVKFLAWLERVRLAVRRNER
jgi:hypothetical protein